MMGGKAKNRYNKRQQLPRQLTPTAIACLRLPEAHGEDTG
jgi:hypothetical protein